MTALSWISRAEPWLQSVLPRQCAGCQLVGRLWCPACSDAVRSHRGGLVPAPLGAPGLIAVVGEHRDLLRAAVLLHKSRHHAGVCSDLVFLAAQAVALVLALLPAVTGSGQRGLERIALVPIPPSSPRAWRSPAGELADRVAAGSSSVDYVPLLKARRRRRSQKSLDAAGRAHNVVGAFEASPGYAHRGGVAVLFDDVVTTGATMAQARRVVEQAGFTVPAAVALTRTPGPSQ